MIRYISLVESISFKSGKEIKDWIISLSPSRRKPTSISKLEHEIIIGLHKIATDPEYKYNEDFRNQLLLNKVSQLHLNKEEYDSVYGEKEDQPNIIKGKYATYKKNDVGSYTRFLTNVEDMESFFSTLKGYHKIPLKDLVVNFVSAQDMKTPAKWRSSIKEIWINPLSKKVGNTKEEYGSLRYIVLHELGHKFLDMKPQKWNISDPKLYTTKYSMTNPNTLTEEESFAELFALSHWENKYKQYKNQIEEFKKRIK